MVLAGSENNEIAFGSISKPNSPLEEESLLFKDDPSFGNNSNNNNNSLSRQNSSLFSLTLNEIQNKSGKSVGSMNMDEFLANLWSVDVDENEDHHQVPPNSNGQQQQVKHDDVDRDNCNNSDDNHSDKVDINVNANNLPKLASVPAPLARQGSFSIPAPLCKKTVDEIWFEIQKDQPDDNGKPNLNLDARVETPPPLRHLTLGEMTLEDFLVKAGIVQEARRAPQAPSAAAMVASPATPATPGASSLQKMVTPMQNINACLDVTFGMGTMMGMAFPTPPQNVANSFPPTANGGFAPYPLFPQNKGYVGDQPPSNDAAPNDQAQTEPGPQQNKKRIIDGPPEVVVERRQRRMIKNRESAARSRARKQAYTVELELELTQLKEENVKLKQLVEEIEQNRKEEVRKIKSKKTQKAEKMKNIRRTVSLAW